MGLGFSTLGSSLDVVICPGCLMPSDGMSCAVMMEMCSGSPRKSCLVERSLCSQAKGLSPGPGGLLSRTGSQYLRHWERWLSPARRWVATHVRSVHHEHVDPKLLGTLKS